MKDFFGQELKKGDEVAFMEPNYRNMVVGKIISFAPKSMLIEWDRNYRFAISQSGPHLMTFRASSEQVIKKPL